MRFDVYFVLILNKIVPIYRCAYVSQVLSQCQAITLLSFLEKWLIVKCKYHYYIYNDLILTRYKYVCTSMNMLKIIRVLLILIW